MQMSKHVSAPVTPPCGGFSRRLEGTRSTSTACAQLGTPELCLAARGDACPVKKTASALPNAPHFIRLSSLPEQRHKIPLVFPRHSHTMASYASHHALPSLSMTTRLHDPEAALSLPSPTASEAAALAPEPSIRTRLSRENIWKPEYLSA
jgi:hypothetical protein